MSPLGYPSTPLPEKRVCAIICRLSQRLRHDQGGRRTTFLMEEREFFDERSDKKPANLNCPHCHQSAEYEINWLVRTKKRNLPPRADERDRARFAKASSYMVRKDDVLMCKNMRCRKRFEITSVQSVVSLD